MSRSTLADWVGCSALILAPPVTAAEALRRISELYKIERSAQGRAADERTAAILTLIETAKLNGVDPEARLRDVLARIQDHPARRIDELLPWNAKPDVPTSPAPAQA